ncbi:MAG TPA: hypothetical protein DCY80_19960 [Solibacterales bacterium]|nr:hypothetical protein [Bryobacterales bacterium]
MVEEGEDLAFVAEPVEDVGGVHTALDDLDGDFLLELVIITNGAIDGAHAAAADRFSEAPGAEAGSGGEVLFKGGLIEEFAGLLVGGEQGFDFGAEIRIVLTGGIKEGGTEGWGLFQDLGENGFDLLPAGGGHGVGAAPLSSR